MIAATGHALEQALAYYRAPAMLSVARDRRLPDDVLDVLRIAAGDEALAAQGAGSSGEPQAAVVDAAVFFVQQVLFAPGADSYRVLGVNDDAPDARIKENYRWLVRWLHPDRNLDDWDSVYAERVNRAWQDLRLPDRRSAYDLQRASGEASAPAVAPPLVRPLGRLHANPSPGEALMSARTAQRLPMFVLGGLGLAAVSMLALMWYATVGQGVPPSAPVQASEILEPDAMHAGVDTSAAEPAPPAAAPAKTAPLAVAIADTALEPAAMPVRETPGSQVPGGDTVDPPAPAAAPSPAPVARVEPAPEAAAPHVAPAPVVPAPVAQAPVIQAPATQARRPAPPATSPRAAAPAGSLAAVVAAPAPQEPVVPRVDRQQAYGVLDNFSTAYAAGDINALMRLFTRDARNNRGGRDAIVFDYQSLFSATLERELRFKPSGWMQGEPDKATLLATYQARVTVAGKRRPDATRGQIRFDLRREDGVLRISQIRLENAE